MYCMLYTPQSTESSSDGRLVPAAVDSVDLDDQSTQCRFGRPEKFSVHSTDFDRLAVQLVLFSAAGTSLKHHFCCYRRTKNCHSVVMRVLFPELTRLQVCLILRGCWPALRPILATLFDPLYFKLGMVGKIRRAGQSACDSLMNLVKFRFL